MAFRQRLGFHGILLYRKNYREHDMLIKFLTAERGKRMFLVRGARRNRFRMAADLLPFTYGVYEGSFAKRGLCYITSALDTHHYLNLIRNIKLNAYATYIMGLIDAAFPDNQMILKWFDKLFYGLKLINQGLNPEIIADIFEIQLLPVFGVAPNLKRCSICGRTNLPFDYSEKYGGLLCAKHWDKDPYRFHLDAKTVFDLQRFSVIPLKKIGQIQVRHKTEWQLRRLLNHIYHDSVGLTLKSKRFLDQMRQFDW